MCKLIATTSHKHHSQHKNNSGPAAKLVLRGVKSSIRSDGCGQLQDNPRAERLFTR